MKRSSNGYATAKDVTALTQRVERLGVQMERLFDEMRSDVTRLVSSVREASYAVQEDVDTLFIEVALVRQWQEAHDRRRKTSAPRRVDLESQDRRTITDNMRMRFSDDELRSVAFALDIPFDDLPGDTHSRKCEELISWMERHSRLGELVDYCREIRPLLVWPIIVSEMREEDLKFEGDENESR